MLKDPWKLSRLACAATLLAAHAPATLAYVGPGAGLGMLAALFAIVLAILATIVGIVLWPIRKLRQRQRERQAKPETTDTSATRE